MQQAAHGLQVPVLLPEIPSPLAPFLPAHKVTPPQAELTTDHTSPLTLPPDIARVTVSVYCLVSVCHLRPVCVCHINSACVCMMQLHLIGCAMLAEPKYAVPIATSSGSMSLGNVPYCQTPPALLDTC